MKSRERMMSGVATGREGPQGMTTGRGSWTSA